MQKCFKDPARYDLTDGICGSDHVELDMLEL